MIEPTMMKTRDQKKGRILPSLLQLELEDLTIQLSSVARADWSLHERKVLPLLKKRILPVLHRLMQEADWVYFERLRPDFLQLQAFYRQHRSSLPLHCLPTCSVSLVTSTQMKQLNGEWRGRWKNTDVLSFPQFELSRVAGVREWLALAREQQPVNLGDLVICYPVMKSQARTFGWTPLEEFSRLLVHGFLHLLGLDHERSRGEDQWMRSLEARILEESGLGDSFYF